MDRDQDADFIQAFVRRERRERAQVELLSPKRRGAFLNRLCHTYQNILDMRYLKSIPAPNSDYRALLRHLLQKQAPETCYVISTLAELDGQHIRLADALEKVVGLGLPSIIICLPGKLGYFEAEQEVGPPPRYMLERT